MTNYGLVRADNLQFRLPSSDGYFRYEFLEGLPDTLAAKESIVIPYRITALALLEPDGSGSGGGCTPYNKNMQVDYGYQCANGATTNGSTGIL